MYNNLQLKKKNIFFETKLDIRYFWKNLVYITQNEDDQISIEDLFLYNLIYAVPFKQNWGKQKLISNLITNEPGDNSVLLSYLEKDPEFIENLYIKIKPFSSVNNGDTIDIDNTLKRIYL